MTPETEQAKSPRTRIQTGVSRVSASHIALPHGMSIGESRVTRKADRQGEGSRRISETYRPFKKLSIAFVAIL
jgi:hypothetical protein